MNSRAHEDPVLFREAVSFTSAETRFLTRLIEKDYFCTILLEYLAANVGRLVFKGGTCLAKVHADFYRLSEDLDFVIPVSISTSRSERRDLTAGLKTASFSGLSRIICARNSVGKASMPTMPRPSGQAERWAAPRNGRYFLPATCRNLRVSRPSKS